MKVASVDWSYVWRGTLLPIASLLVSAALMVGSIWYFNQMAEEYQSYTRSQDTLHSDYNELIYQRRLIEKYHQRYRELQAVGFVGYEQRVDWIESIHNTAKDLDLPSVNYSVESQQNLVIPVATRAAVDTRAFVSHLSLELGLVHELDLMRFMNRLNGEAPGIMKVDQCELTRQNSEPQQLLTAETNIHARCDLMIYTVITEDANVEGVHL